MSYNQRKFIRDLKSVLNSVELGEIGGFLRSIYSTSIDFEKVGQLQGFISEKIVDRYEITVQYQGYSIAKLYSWFDVDKNRRYRFLLLTANGYGDAITTRMRIRDVLDTVYDGAPCLLYKKGDVSFQYANAKTKIPWDTTSDGVGYCKFLHYSDEWLLTVYSNAHWSKFIGLDFWTPERIYRIEAEFNS